MSNDPMAEIRASFFVECEELLEGLQDALTAMDAGGDDPETVNTVFRAVHSIKGGAGAFGLDALVGFAHQFETVLDELRGGRIAVTDAAVKLFFRAADTLQDQVRAARDERDPPTNADTVLAALSALLGDAGPAGEEETPDFAPTGLALDLDALPGPEEPPAETHWRIRFTPGAGLYASGNEALHILRSLSQLGRAQITCLIPEDLPAPTPENAETPWLSWLIALQGEIEESDITQLFDFVADLCVLEITQHPDEAASMTQDMVSVVEAARGDPEHRKTSSTQPVDSATQPADSRARLTLPLPPVADSLPAPNAADPPFGPSRAASAPPVPEPAATVRVDLEKIDRLVNLVGELVINQAMLAQSVEEAGIGHHSDVMNGLESFMTLTRDIQESVMMIRAQPVKSLFQRMGRIVREASASVGKEVRLQTDGEYTEVDKTVIERLADPLTHMIRNAVDHGLEAPAQRAASGKPPEGVIRLSASHRAGRVLIELEDDGAGINRPKVRDTAISRGLIAPDAQLTEPEIDGLLFLPGFSTASEISSLSGRGVGMDVVKSAITALGGRISIASAPGSGTKFSISLPLTLAVLDGMVVQAADQTLVVPLSAIIETAKLEDANIQRLSASGDMMQIRGEFVPLFDLGRQLGFRARSETARSGIVLLTAQDNGHRAALIVDAIMEQRQVVIKGLGQNYGNIPGVAAATILGDGKIALILDPADLARCGRHVHTPELKAAG
ncbi:two-component system, chemotaxis family, sensor kinase CheA [Paracoccus isoporae]|uniref:Chemotaxis protein CheA n=1 Tax=Paracoccus isoporae TaxID=591205 RepID=A0A1G6WER5_9RHOB|nr:chemotaxis protein CheA [Paracoccus isoporae]SDD63555.1 two-component system, chemotaxis family, sensor kinase CheA [Paracoccus isoporae]